MWLAQLPRLQGKLVLGGSGGVTIDIESELLPAGAVELCEPTCAVEYTGSELTSVAMSQAVVGGAETIARWPVMPALVAFSVARFSKSLEVL